jgi:hypothetical protein
MASAPRRASAVTAQSCSGSTSPRVVFPVMLAGKSGAAALALTWDPVEQSAEPARSQPCATLTYALGLDRGAALCLECLAGAGAPPRGALTR